MSVKKALIVVLFVGLTMLVSRLPPIAHAARTTTYTVTNTNDSGLGSLRQAIIDANNHSGPDTIEFSIPGCQGTLTNACLIQPGSLLPSLTGGSTTIDGTTQSDTNSYGPDVLLDGSNLSSTSWIFSVESDQNTIKGLAITRAGAAGIKIIAGAKNNVISDNYIGTDPAGVWAWGNGTGVEVFGGASFNDITQNLISGNTVDGVRIAGNNTDFNNIRSNRIGLDSSGVVAIPNGRHGILILNGPDFTNVGGDTTHRNYISGNTMYGVYITGSGSDNNLVARNYIGTNISGAWAVSNGYSGVAVTDGATHNIIQDNLISGNAQNGVYIKGSGTNDNFVRLNIIGADALVTSPIPNGWHGVGVYDGPQRNWIGTPAPQWGNTIVASSWSGVAIVNSDNNTVMLNAIGTDMSGTATNLGNSAYGVHVGGMNNTIGPGNTIAYNGSDGVRVDGGSVTTKGNQITKNSIFSNVGKGIELINGGNTELWTPTITSANCQQVDGSTGAGWTVEVFSDAADEGGVYEGTTTAHAILPSFSYSGTVNGPNVTVTATDNQGNTSEFSPPFSIGLCNTAPVAAFMVNPTGGPPNTTFSFDASGSSDLEDPATALQVRWDWENDGTFDTGWSTTKTATHSYTAPNLYTIRLQVQDTGGLTSDVTHQVTVNASANAPTAAFTVNPIIGPANTVFTFDASGSSDLEDPVPALQVRWDWENDGTYDTAWSNTKTTTHSYTVPNLYTIRLQVKDTGGLTGETTHQVTVTAATTLKVFLPLVVR